MKCNADFKPSLRQKIRFKWYLIKRKWFWFLIRIKVRKLPPLPVVNNAVFPKITASDIVNVQPMTKIDVSFTKKVIK
jgi:hypothetical protein